MKYSKNKVEEIVQKMSLEEKIAQLQCLQLGREPAEDALEKYPYGVGQITTFGGKSSVKENIEEMNKIEEKRWEITDIPPIMHMEAVTGLNAANATVFPSAIGLGATWDPEVVYKMADVIHRQMLAIGARQALSPVMDVARDPRWGRMGETYGEDPTLCSAMSVAFTKGLQTDDLKNGVLATGKHFLGYGLCEGGLNMAANPIPERELREVYAKPFQAAITEAGLGSVMNSYGSIDGDLIIQSENILTRLLREEMGFEGITVSDYMSLDKAVDLKVCSNPLDGGIRALKAGLDMELPAPYGYTDSLAEAIRDGSLSEDYIDRAVTRIIRIKDKLGILEDGAAPRENIAEEAYDRERVKPIAIEAARKSIVLLKNNGVLPLKKDSGMKIAIIGPHGNSLRLLFGCYTYPATLDMLLSGSMHDVAGLEKEKNENRGPSETYYPGTTIRKESERVNEVLKKLYGGITPTIFESIKQKAGAAEVSYIQGCEIAGTDRNGFQDAVHAACNSDLVILTLGGKYGWGSNCTTGEGIDTDRIGLPGVQEELAKEICSTGKPVIAVHMDTKPLCSEYIKQHCDALLEIWFPGDTGGEALADVLFGDYNPAGRLPVTAPRNTGQIPVYASQRRGSGYHKAQGMTLSKYVEGTKQPLYYFGEGRSYTSFAYSNLSITYMEDVKTVKICCNIKNTGDFDGEEVVQLYISDEEASMLRPEQELVGFKRIFLKKREQKRVCFSMKVSQMAFLDKNMQWVVEKGNFIVRLGSSSEKIFLEGKFYIPQNFYVDGQKRGFYADTDVTGDIVPD